MPTEVYVDLRYTDYDVYSASPAAYRLSPREAALLLSLLAIAEIETVWEAYDDETREFIANIGWSLQGG